MTSRTGASEAGVVQRPTKSSSERDWRFQAEGLRIANGSTLLRLIKGNAHAPFAIIGERAAGMRGEAHGL